MCIKNTHFKCLKSYYRISRVEVTHLFLECNNVFSSIRHDCDIIPSLKVIKKLFIQRPDFWHESTLLKILLILIDFNIQVVNQN